MHTISKTAAMFIAVLLFSIQAQALCSGLTLRVEPDQDGNNALSSAISSLKSIDETSVTILLSAGTHRITEPIRLTPETIPAYITQLTIESDAGASATISAAREIGGGRALPDGRWSFRLSDIEWNFQQLFVNGNRRQRARLPRADYYTIADAVPLTTGSKGYDRFHYKPGDLDASWKNPADVEVIASHLWTASRLRIATIDPETSTVVFTGPTHGTEYFAALGAGKRYLVENVYEGLDEPGEWYLDRQSRELIYYPMPGETLEGCRVEAPVAEKLLIISGDTSRTLQNITLRNVRLEHSNYMTPPQGQTYPQAALNVGGAVELSNAENCRFENVTIAHTGHWGITLGEKCTSTTIVDCTLFDIGAGGIYIGPNFGPGERGDHVVSNTLIIGGGRLHSAGVGVLIGRSSGNQIIRNTIHDFYYTGISVGWSWGYEKSTANHNLIRQNRISKIGQGVLSDMGGIYTLGVSPGTRLEKNYITDIHSFDYGGWGIYFDEGSTGIVAEDNIVSGTKTGAFHQHYGRENIVRNNVLAFGGTYIIARTRAEDHLSFTLERNVFVWDDAKVVYGNWDGDNYRLDSNLYWAMGREPKFPGGTLKQWRASGRDKHSIIADPRFINPLKDDYRFRAGSPAECLGIKSISTRDIGATRPIPEEAILPPAFPVKK